MLGTSLAPTNKNKTNVPHLPQLIGTIKWDIDYYCSTWTEKCLFSFYTLCNIVDNMTHKVFIDSHGGKLWLAMFNEPIEVSCVDWLHLLEYLASHA